MAAAPRYVGSTVAEAVAYVREAIGDDTFLRVFDLDGDGEVETGSDDEKAFVRAVCSAETEVDEMLGASHAAPFVATLSSPTPDSVREIAAQRALWCAVRWRSMAGDLKAPYRLLYDDTTARLRRLATDNGGRIPSVGAPAPVSSVGAGMACVADGPRVFGDLADGVTRGGF
jgi:hypothetical protein